MAELFSAEKIETEMTQLLNSSAFRQIRSFIKMSKKEWVSNLQRNTDVLHNVELDIKAVRTAL